MKTPESSCKNTEIFLLGLLGLCQVHAAYLGNPAKYHIAAKFSMAGISIVILSFAVAWLADNVKNTQKDALVVLNGIMHFVASVCIIVSLILGC